MKSLEIEVKFYVPDNDCHAGAVGVLPPERCPIEK
jgi:hypothetical protein